MRTINEMVYVTSEIRSELQRAFSVLSALKDELASKNEPQMEGSTDGGMLKKREVGGIMVDLDDQITMLGTDVSSITLIANELYNLLLNTV